MWLTVAIITLFLFISLLVGISVLNHDSQEMDAGHEVVYEKTYDPYDNILKECEEGDTNECYYNSAMENSDHEYCMNIDDDAPEEKSRDACIQKIAEINNKLKTCSGISKDSGPYSIDSCFFMYAIRNNDPSICGEILAEEGEYSIQNCYDELGVKS